MNILEEIKQERSKQDSKWGEQNHDPLKWMSILMEEVGECAKDVLDKKLESYRKEMIQVAAVAVAAIESLDRNTFAEVKITIEKIKAELPKGLDTERFEMMNMIPDDEILLMFEEAREWAHSGYTRPDSLFFKLAKSFAAVYASTIDEEFKKCISLISYKRNILHDSRTINREAEA